MQIRELWGWVTISAVDGAFFSTTSELPEIVVQNGRNISQKGQRWDLFDVKGTSGNAEVGFLAERRGTLLQKRV